MQFKSFRTWGSIAVVFGAIGLAPVAAQVTVGSGSSWSLGDGAVNWGCSDLNIDGTLSIEAATTADADSVTINTAGTVAGGSGTLGLTGDFISNGAFNKGTSTVAIRDGCGNTTSALSGGQNFHSLSVTTTSGKTLVMASGSTTTIGPGLLTLQGSAGNLLRIRASVPGSQALTSLNGNQNIRYVDVADNWGMAQVLAPGPASASNSVNSGNVLNWFDVLPIIPTLSALGLVLLALGMLAVARLSRPVRQV